jgi:hypothetical protein
LKSQIMADPVVDRILGKEKTWRCTIDDNFAHCVFPYRPLKVGAEQIFNQISEWIEVINRYNRPEQLVRCEGDDCPDREAPIQVVLVNGYPLLLCSQCVTKIPGWGEDLQQAYQTAPTNLSKGLLAGLGAALFGAIIWAAVAVGFSAIAAVISAVVFIGIVKLMDRIGVKRSRSSLMSAAMLTVLSAVLGTYLALAWDAVNELSQGLSINSLSIIMTTAWQNLWATRLLGRSIVVCLLTVVPFLLWTWWEQRKHYAQIFRPVVEVIGTKWF